MEGHTAPMRQVSDGLGKLAEYLDHPDIQILDQGLARAWTGAGKLYQVQQVGRVLESRPEAALEPSTPGTEEDTYHP